MQRPFRLRWWARRSGPARSTTPCTRRSRRSSAPWSPARARQARRSSAGCPRSLCLSELNLSNCLTILWQTLENLLSGRTEGIPHLFSAESKPDSHPNTRWNRDPVGKLLKRSIIFACIFSKKRNEIGSGIMNIQSYAHWESTLETPTSKIQQFFVTNFDDLSIIINVSRKISKVIQFSCRKLTKFCRDFTDHPEKT